MIPLFASLAAADEPLPTVPLRADLLRDARRLEVRGGAWAAAGTALTAGGLAVLLVHEGAPGDPITDPPPVYVADLRSAGGAVMVMGGLTAVLAGARDLSMAAGLKDRAAKVSVLPAPNGLAVAGRF